MIRSVTGGDAHLTVSSTSAYNYINNTLGAQGVGNVRFNTASQRFEVFDGYTWLQIQMADVTVTVSADVRDSLDWVRGERDKQRRIKELAARYPAVADQLAVVDQAQERLDIIAALVSV